MAMKMGSAMMKAGAIVLTITMGVIFIWWRYQIHRESNPWKYAEYHERIIAEARVNGDVYQLRGSDGKTYYVMMPGTKSGMLVRPEEMNVWHYRSLWESSRDMPDEYRGRGSKGAGYAINNGGLRDYEGNHLGVGVTLEDVAPGTTVEELMARDAE